ncbi:ferritin family protein [Micromonospora echinofusca]|uniref:Rubrerythrin family protein n=1 Tax=Micromonospora echinofusca TaxID=47858 RepID=A0ABS3VJM6_MICEH|nr:ferritin family protein [Micromonospora echinofusca]MBO4204730.1 rubrerythrin family protein [Micromonospora echinofusca]
MRTAKGMSIMVVSATLGLALVGSASAAPRPVEVDPGTRADASTAMAGEAYTYASYLAYGQVADRTGDRRLGRLFRDTARVELYDHFTAEARLIGFVGGNEENLADSIAGEEEEATVTYPAFAEQARRDNCPEVAAHFAELAADEAVHAGRFRTALTAVTDPGSGVEVPVGERVQQIPVEVTEPQCSGQTLANLRATLRGEAFATAKYTLHAQQARRTGQTRLLRLWENTAWQELNEHFAGTANLAGLAGSNEENLRTSITGETDEATVMYPTFSREAYAVGDRAAGALFREIAYDEADHASAFLRALVRVVTPPGAGTRT